MRPNRRRYIAACQRLLALGVVVVALVPAAGVVSLDVVGVAPTKPVVPQQPVESTIQTPVPGRSADPADRMREYAVETTQESEVPAAPVDPIVREVSLTPRMPAPRAAVEGQPVEGQPSRGSGRGAAGRGPCVCRRQRGRQ